MTPPALAGRHISELHDRAAELGVERYRLLAREALVEAILEKDPEAGEQAETSQRQTSQRRPSQREGSQRQGGRAKPASGRSGERGGGHQKQGKAPPPFVVPDGPVEGKLEISGRGHGFLRLSGDQPADGDIYISASQIRRCELKDGDVVSGPARGPRRGERHPALVHVDAVNGEAPGEDSAKFAELTAIPASRPIALGLEALKDIPLMHGHRVLVEAGSNPDRTPFLRALASVLGASEDFETVVVLIDEMPEELVAWSEVDGVELVTAAADLRSREQLRIAEKAAAKAIRAVESGADVVLLIDSLSRLATAADDAGVVKPIFGAGRETAEEEAGSLTVIATTIEGAGDDGAVHRAIATTENVLIVLDELSVSA